MTSIPAPTPSDTPTPNPAAFACATCHARKVRCDKKSPCSYCATRGIECSPVVQGEYRRKKRFPEAELLARLRKYEAALSELGLSPEKILEGELGEVEHIASQLKQCGLNGAGEASTGDISARPRGVEAAVGRPGLDDATPTTSQHKPYATPDPTDILFFHQPSHDIDLPSLHPPPSVISQLWQLYVYNAHPLLRFFHIQLTQQYLFSTMHHMTGVAAPWHALIFSVYCVALHTVPDDTVADLIGDRKAAIARFQAAAMHALRKAEILNSNNILVLRALMLYLVSLYHSNHDSRVLHTLCSLAERIARRIKCHLDTEHSRISPFLVEMRKRLWWQLMAIQQTASEYSESGLYSLSWDWQTDLPANIDETDLDPAMSSLPLSVAGDGEDVLNRARRTAGGGGGGGGVDHATGMIFCLVGAEIVSFLKATWQSVQARIPDFRNSEFANPVMSLAEKLSAIAAFEIYLEQRHLRHCIPQNPLHIVTRYHATHCIAKMRIAAYTSTNDDDNDDNIAAVIPGMLRSQNQSHQSQPFSSEQQTLLGICIDTIRVHSAALNDPMAQRFRWYLTLTPPLLAYAHLLRLLKQDPLDEQSQQAWDLLLHVWVNTSNWEEYPIFPFFTGKQVVDNDSQDLAAAAIAAWEAREVALRAHGRRDVEVPEMVSSIRAALRGLKARNRAL